MWARTSKATEVEGGYPLVLAHGSGPSWEYLFSVARTSAGICADALARGSARPQDIRTSPERNSQTVCFHQQQLVSCCCLRHFSLISSRSLKDAALNQSSKR